MNTSAPIRVGLLATITDYGGIEKVLLNMLQHMDASVELRPILFSRADLKEAAFFDQLEALQIPHVRFVNTRKRRYYNVVRNMRDALAILRDERVDVVHCHGYRADLLGLIAAARYHLPVVSTCHGFIATDRNQRVDTDVLAAAGGYSNQVSRLWSPDGELAALGYQVVTVYG